jgi:hypothetical protein
MSVLGMGVELDIEDSGESDEHNKMKKEMTLATREPAADDELWIS